MVNNGCLFIVGGGRWARIIAETILLASTCDKIYIVTKYCKKAVLQWAVRKNIRDKISVLDSIASINFGRLDKVIIANVASGHKSALEDCLNLGAKEVLVEKPFVLTANDAVELISLSKKCCARLYTSHVFLFANYWDLFSKRSELSAPITSGSFVWTDPAHEERYGEIKRHDPFVPVFKDWLPHIYPILKSIFEADMQRIRVNKIDKVGDFLELQTDFGLAQIVIEMDRRADRRRRMLELRTKNESVSLDFSSDLICFSKKTLNLQRVEKWKSNRPLAAMLCSFLDDGCNKENDWRFDIGLAQKTCELSDFIQLELQKRQNRCLRDKSVNKDCLQGL